MGPGCDSPAPLPQGASSERWAELQDRADVLEKQLSCAEILRRVAPDVPLTFAGMDAARTDRDLSERNV